MSAVTESPARTPSTVTVERERFDAFLSDPLAIELLAEHHAEVGHPDIPLALNSNAYRAMESSGALRIFTARVDGALVGYAAYQLATTEHSELTVQAVSEAVFVRQAFRRRGVGLRLLRTAELLLAGEGVALLFVQVKNKHPQVGRVLERLGFEPTETVYGKVLRRG